MDTQLAVKIIEEQGFENAAAIVEASQQPYRPKLERLLAMIENESHGRNVFGDEEGACPKSWLETEVTKWKAEAFWRRVLEGEGSNGVGPTQITEEDLLASVKDHELWVPLRTIEVGAAYLHGLIIHFGLGEGFRRYNGFGADAIDYRDRALVYAGEWAHRLAPALK